MPTKKGSWRDKGKGDCFTRTNKSGASYVVCEGSKGQKGVYKKGAKPKPKTKSPVKEKKKTKLIKKPKTAESKKKIEAILRKKKEKEKEKKKKESKAEKEERKETKRKIKVLEKRMADPDDYGYNKPHIEEKRKKTIAKMKKRLK